jgi:hypothetical protein
MGRGWHCPLALLALVGLALAMGLEVVVGGEGGYVEEYDYGDWAAALPLDGVTTLSAFTRYAAHIVPMQPLVHPAQYSPDCRHGIAAPPAHQGHPPALARVPQGGLAVLPLRPRHGQLPVPPDVHPLRAGAPQPVSCVRRGG